jgi:hypothetical protein
MNPLNLNLNLNLNFNPVPRERIKIRPRAMVLLVALILTLLFMAPGARTQYPYPYAYPAVPTPALTGPTVRDSVRNAVTATSTQAEWLVNLPMIGAGERCGLPTPTHSSNSITATCWGTSNPPHPVQCGGLLGAQLGQARSDNAVAELDAGLNMIAELFTFLQTQYNAGTLDNKTVVRTLAGALRTPCANGIRN